MNTITVEAPCLAAFVTALTGMDHETHAVVTATENGRPWARVELSPMTDTLRAVFPVDAYGLRGDARKRGQSGVVVGTGNATAALSVVVNRARRMAAA
jgi:hypothetical protein